MQQHSTSALSTQGLHTHLQRITVPRDAPNARFVNWGLSYACNPLAVFEPESEYDCALVLELARREHRSVRVVGVGHSPSDLACTTDYMLRTRKLNKLLEVNQEKNYIVAQGGITLQELHDVLAEHNLAMSNIGSISDTSLAGVIATATHGSGINYGVLSKQVLGLTLLLADGSRIVCSPLENPDLFNASLCGLGSTGLILSVKLEVERLFRLKEFQWTRKFDDAIDNLPEIVNSAEHVRFWWFPQNGNIRCSAADRTLDGEAPAASWLWHRLLGYHVIQLLLFLGRYFLSMNTWAARFAEWLISGDTVGVDVSHRIFNVECRYPQYTTEWAIPYHNAQACLRDLRTWFDEEFADPQGLRPHFPVEIRFSAADDIWLSPSSGQTTCWLGIVQYKPYKFDVPYRKMFQRFENIVGRHGGKPHWAKAHGLRPDALRTLYPYFGDFVKVLEEVDPNGVFRNPYVRRHIFGEEGPGLDRGIFEIPHTE